MTDRHLSAVPDDAPQGPSVDANADGGEQATPPVPTAHERLRTALRQTLLGDAMAFAEDAPVMMHAINELSRIGGFSEDGAQSGIAEVLELVAIFSQQGHDATAANWTAEVFSTLAKRKPLTPITSDPSEWVELPDFDGGTVWQARRDPACISRDGGATWHDQSTPLPASVRTVRKPEWPDGVVIDDLADNYPKGGLLVGTLLDVTLVDLDDTERVVDEWLGRVVAVDGEAGTIKIVKGAATD